MFEKLLANLPYNPDLVKQVGFYAHRMRREESIRRTGLVFVVLAFLVQFLAFLAPPATTAAYSNSDMINGGFTSKSQAVDACKNNTKHYGDVLWNFKITCADVANGTTVTLNSQEFNGRLYSLSWTSYGATNPNSGKATNETQYTLPKVGQPIYARLLTSADTLYANGSNYQVLKITASDGSVYWLMYLCGNLVTVGIPKPAPVCRANGNVYYAGDAACQPVARVCPYDASLTVNDATCTACPYSPTITKSDARCVPCPYDATLLASDRQCPQPCQYNNSLAATDAACQPPVYVSPTPPAAGTPPAVKTAIIIDSKSAANTTQGLADANNTTAQPGDTIVYTLNAANQGTDQATGYVMQDDLSDVMEYATVTGVDGGILNNTVVSWPAATIAPGTVLTHKITVVVKNPVPNTAPAAGNPNSFDHIMTNVYGTAINIRVATPAIVTAVAATATGLPNTGPGAGIILAAAIAVVAGYFFARARLLVHESVLVMQESYSGTL